MEGTDEEIIFVLDSIFSKCPKNMYGQVEAIVLIDALCTETESNECIREHLRRELDPHQSNPSISRETMVNIVKEILGKGNNNNIFFSMSPTKQTVFTSTPLSTRVPKSGTLMRPKKLLPCFEGMEDKESPLKADWDNRQTEEMLRVEVFRLKSERQELESSLNKAEALNQSLRTKLTEISNLNTKLKKESEEFIENMKRLTNLEESCLEQEREIQQLKKEKSAVVSSNQKKDIKISQMEQSLFCKNSEIDDLRKGLEERSKFVADLKGQTLLMEERLAEIASENENLKQEKSDFQNKIEALTIDNQNHIAKISEILNEKKGIQMELAELNASRTVNFLESQENTSTDVVVDFKAVIDPEESISLERELQEANEGFGCVSIKENEFWRQVPDVVEVWTQTDTPENITSQQILCGVEVWTQTDTSENTTREVLPIHESSFNGMQTVEPCRICILLASQMSRTTDLLLSQLDRASDSRVWGNEPRIQALWLSSEYRIPLILDTENNVYYCNNDEETLGFQTRRAGGWFKSLGFIFLLFLIFGLLAVADNSYWWKRDFYTKIWYTRHSRPPPV